MDIWLLLILAGILAEYRNILVLCQPMTPKNFIKSSLLEAEVDLAKSFSRREKDSSHLLNVSTTEPWTAKLGFDEARPFWAFSQTHILADNSIYRLEGNEFGSMKLREVAQLPEMILVEGTVFIEVVEWRRILFLMVAYKSDLCKIYTATPSMKITERQKITNVGAKDGEFFVHGNDLYLVVVSSKPEHHDVPSTIYRWTGTHFDIVETFMTSGAVAVSTFLFKGTVIITVAQYPYDKPAIGSQVFRWSHNRLERMQFLPTNGPIALQYMEAYGESYLLVINDYEFSSLFWWTGKEFITWDNFYEVKGMSKISIGYMGDETLILIALKDKIKVYRLLETRLHRLTTVSLFDGEEILSMSIHPDENVKLIAVSRKDGSLSTSIFNLHLVKGPFGENQQKMDPLLQCLLSLNDKLLSREALVKKLELKMPKILSVKRKVFLQGKLVVNGLIRFKKGILKMINGVGKAILSSSALQIYDKVQRNDKMIVEAKATISQLVKKSSPGYITGELHIHQDLLLKRGIMKNLSVKYLNGKVFDPSNMLRYSSDQKIPGTIALNTLKASKMNCKELNGIFIEDLLLNYGNQQVSGRHKVQGIKVNNLQIVGKETINDVKLDLLVRKDMRAVRGRKEWHMLQAKYVKISYFNGEDMSHFGEGMVSKEGGEYFLKGLKFHSKLIIESLNVTDLNEIQWDSFKEAVFLIGENQRINGKMFFNGTVRTDDLSADYVNDVSPTELMTSSTKQVINSIINVKVLKATDLGVTVCNGLDIAVDLARYGYDNYIKGFVRMADIQVINVTSEVDAVWVGIPKPNELKHSLVYDCPVLIKGNLLAKDADVVSGSIIINGSHVDISRLKDDFLMTSAKEVTIHTLHATNNLKIFGNLFSSQVNGVDASNIVHIGSTEELHGINFASITTSYFTIDPHISISGVDVGLLFNTTVMVEGDFLVKGNKKFVGGIIADDLHTRWMNGADMTLMVHLKNPILNLGNKTFDKIQIKGDIEAKNVEKLDRINSLDLSSIFSHAVRIDVPFSLNSIELSTITSDQIQVSMLNKIDFNSFVKSLDPQSSVIHIKEVIINGEIEFSGPLDIESLNGINICRYLDNVFDKKIGGRVEGQKKFVGNIIITDSLESTFFNNLDMVSLEKYHFSKTKSQTVEGYFEMKNVSLYELEVNAINGKDMNVFFVKKSDPQVINGNVKLLDLYLNGDLEVSVLNDCQIGKVGEYLNGDLDTVHFKLLNVTNEITWNEERPFHNSLSNLFTNTVRMKYGKVINGEVLFLGDTFSKNVFTEGGINGVNLKFLADDCVKKSEEDQVLFGQKIFLSSVNVSRVIVTHNANIKWINGIDIPLVNKTLVRKTGFHEVEGHKTFLEGFETEKLRLTGLVSGVAVSNIVSLNAEMLPAVEVPNLWVSEDLNFMTVNSMNLSRFLTERITCDDLHEVDSSLTFSGNIVLQGETQTSLINNIDPRNAVLLDSDLVQEITGKKVFLQDILVEGDVNFALVNGYNITEEYILGLVGNENVTIDGNVVFASGTVMDTDVLVKNFVNEIDLHDLYNSALAALERNMGFEKRYLIKMQEIIEESLKVCDATAHEFMYLAYEDQDSSETVNSSVNSRHPEVVTMDIFDADECGLPADCLCVRQISIRMFDENFTLMPSRGGLRSYMVQDESGERGAKLFSTTVSRDDRCRQWGEKLENEYNRVEWMVMDDETGELTSYSQMDAFTFEGYVTDVKSFTVESDMYIVVSVFYDAKKSSHNINSLVLKWADGAAEASVVQHIPTFGAMVLEIIRKDSGIYLFVGNAYDSDLKTRDVSDDVYRFDMEREQFLLLRSISTTGTNSATSISIQGHYFLIKGQDFNAPVAIYKYSEEYDNFYFYQNLYIPRSTLGVSSFCLGGERIKDCYVAVAATDDKIHLFKYNHVEGFRKVWEQRLKGILSVKPFTHGKHGFLAAATFSGINVMRIVVQGS